MTANSNKSKQGNKAAHRVIAGVLCGASVLSLVLSLVMPPISQAIANDAQEAPTEEPVMGGGSSSESTDVDGTNVNAENQNSDEVEGGEAGFSNSDEQAQAEDQPEDELQVEDGDSPNDGAVMAAAEGEQAETASGEISNATELKTKLTDANDAVSFKLVDDIDTSETITLNKDGSNITLDLNGHKIKHNSSDQTLFSITGGATLTVIDGRQAAVDDPTGDKYVCSDNTLSKNGNLASVAYDETSKIPAKLTYYVTGSSVNKDGTSTTETLYKHEASIGGAIVACSGSQNLRLITISNGGHFNLESGMITQGKDSNVKNLVYSNNSTVNMNGGYVCGGYCPNNAAGAGISVENSTTLDISGGVIAGNSAPSGGGVYAKGSTVTMSGGIISGNSTHDGMSGYGGGIMGEGSNITVSGGYITNNAYRYNYETQSTSDKHKGNGCHGGGGIAALSSGEGQKNGSLAINGGYITGNYSAEAGGGVYAGAWNRALSTFTFSGGTIASNVAQNSEGGGIRIAAPTVGDFNVSGKKAYITNNTTNTTNDWGGGGVFVQGGANGVQSASLKIYNALITNNHANGFGGGFAACPTGKTAITDTNGIAIFGNSDGKSDGSYNRSGGTNGKSEDWDFNKNEDKGGEITPEFIKAGHKDLFLVHDSNNSENNPYIAAVTGQMLGGGAANWSGTIDDNTSTSIGKYEGAQAKYLIGLKSDPSAEDQETAKGLATLFITGNKSNIHGGGIMTNGDVVAGSTQEVKVYPKMKLNGSKVFEGGTLKGNDFDFQLLKQNKIIDKQGGITYTVPSFDSNRGLQLNGCSVVNTVKNDKNGNFSFDLGEVYADDDLVYYLVEVPGTDKDVNYDKAIYKIDPTVTEDLTRMHEVLGIKYRYYTVSNVKITKMSDGTTEPEAVATPTSEGDVACVALSNGATFTNTYTQYTSTGSWTPKATKVVEGGEMKEFTLEFADNPDFAGAQTVKTTANDKMTQTLEFHEIKYDLGSLKQNDSGVPGRGASKTFTYYVREKNDSSIFSHYKFDKSVYKFTVVATDKTDGAIDCQVTYRKGTVGSDGKWVNDDTADHKLTDTTPTFTNTYSTSLPLSGMSGVTLTYLAGAAVLCAAAAWMHIRRKANAKGGERRE